MTLNKTLQLPGTLFSWRTRYILVIYKCTFFSDCNFWCCLESKATYFDRGFLSFLTLGVKKKRALQFCFPLQHIYTLSLYSKCVIPFCSWNTFSFQSLAVVEAFLAPHAAASLFCEQQREAALESDFKPFAEKRKGQTLRLYVSTWVMI